MLLKCSLWETTQLCAYSRWHLFSVAILNTLGKYWQGLRCIKMVFHNSNPSFSAKDLKMSANTAFSGLFFIRVSNKL